MSNSEILALVQRESEAFEQKIWWRDLREIAAAGIGFVFFVPMLLVPSWLTRAGAVLVMSGCVFIAWRLRRARTAHPDAPADSPLAETLQAERAKVNAQIQLLRSVLWWYVAPLAVGVVMTFTGMARLPGETWHAVIYAAAVAMLSGAVYWLNQRAVRTELVPRREKLTRLLRQVTG